MRRFIRVDRHCRFKDEGDYIRIIPVRTHIRNVEMSPLRKKGR